MTSSYIYRKFVYWLEESVFEDLKAEISAIGVSVKEAKEAVCAPLSKGIEVGYVLPNTWGSFKLCKSQLSWYHSSGYLGKILLVSSFDLDAYGIRCEVVIRQSAFKPELLPTREEKAKLIERISYKRARPELWEAIASLDNAETERRLNVMGLRGVKFEELFASHCANHANFIEPAYFMLEEGERVPYSICKTSHICSACMEWYNIIGGSFRKKLVVPCPGAVLFAGMITNRYYEVTHWRPKTGDGEDPV
jgi:hypothetical protein